MISKERIPSPEDMREIRRAMQARMVNIALHNFESIGPRTVRALQDLDMIDEVPAMGDDIDLAVLSDRTHERRQKIPDGPLVLYVTEEDEPQLILDELPVLILSDSRDIRLTVMECIENMLEKDPMALTPKTLAILKTSREGLASDTPEEWRPMAIAVYDALNDDVLFSLRGIRQSLQNEPVIQATLNKYAPKVIYPTVTSLDSISLSIGNPVRDHEALQTLLSDIVAKSSNLAELCSAYLEKIGFLPFAPSYSMATAVKKWLSSKTHSIDVWQDVWGWVNSESTPLSRYHACSVFVLFPEMIPDGKLPDLWNEIFAVVEVSGKKNDTCPEPEQWALLRDLVRHYTYHLEARLPENDGASIGCFAWWFAGQVAALFPANASSAKFYRENWVKPALETSTLPWLAASAPIQRSFLRYISLTMQYPWAVALLTMLGEHLNELVTFDQAEGFEERFQDALISNTLSVLPFPGKTPDDPTFVLECSLVETILKWADYQTEENRKGLEQLIEMSNTLGSTEGLENALQNLGEFDLHKQATVCIALKRKVLTDPTIAENVWIILSNEEWRKKVLACVELGIQVFLIESLSNLLIENRGKWSSYLPHYIAELCEMEQDEKRLQILFLYVIHTSLASDTVSAVRRLLRGSHKSKFINYVTEYRGRVERLISDYPPWVAGKLRALMASMHVF